MSNADQVARKLEEIPNVEILTARYVATNADGTVQVDFGKGGVTVYSAGIAEPLPGTFVRTLRISGFTLMLGAVVTESAFGVVVATGTPKLTVQLPNGREVQLGYITTYANPAVDDVVLISWAKGGVVIGPLAEVPTSTYEPPPPATAQPVTNVLEFIATDSGSFYTPGGAWNSADVVSSASNTGAWWYNNVAGSIPDNAAVSLVEIYVTEYFNQHPNVLARVGLHSAGGKSGNPDIRDAAGIERGTGWKTLPNSFGDQLKIGAAAGLGVPTVPGGASYHKFRGRPSDASSGKLRITFSA